MAARHLPTFLAAGLAAVLVAGCGGGSGLPATSGPVSSPNQSAGQSAAQSAGESADQSAGQSAAPSGSSTGLPDFAHVYLLVLENHEYSSVVGSSNAPYLNSLIAKYGLATNSTAVSHPSEPNYIALFSGSTQSQLASLALGGPALRRP